MIEKCTCAYAVPELEAAFPNTSHSRCCPTHGHKARKQWSIQCTLPDMDRWLPAVPAAAASACSSFCVSSSAAAGGSACSSKASRVRGTHPLMAANTDRTSSGCRDARMRVIGSSKPEQDRGHQHVYAAHDKPGLCSHCQICTGPVKMQQRQDRQCSTLWL